MQHFHSSSCFYSWLCTEVWLAPGRTTDSCVHEQSGRLIEGVGVVEAGQGWVGWGWSCESWGSVREEAGCRQRVHWPCTLCSLVRPNAMGRLRGMKCSWLHTVIRKSNFISLSTCDKYTDNIPQLVTTVILLCNNTKQKREWSKRNHPTPLERVPLDPWDWNDTCSGWPGRRQSLCSWRSDTSERRRAVSAHATDVHQFLMLFYGQGCSWVYVGIEPWWSWPGWGWCSGLPRGFPCGGWWCAAWLTTPATGAPGGSCPGNAAPAASSGSQRVSHLVI